MKSFVIILLALEAIAAIIGFINFKKLKGTYWQWFPVFLLLTFLSEMLGFFFQNNRNIFLFRYINIPFSIFFFHYIFFNFFSSKNIRLKIKASFAIYILSLLIEEYFLPTGYKKYGSLSYQIAVISITIFCYYYYRTLLVQNEILNFKSSLMFWFVTGFIAYYVATLPFNAMRNSLWNSNKNIFMAYWYSTFLFNYTMYILYTLGFIWYKQKQ